MPGVVHVSFKGSDRGNQSSMALQSGNGGDNSGGDMLEARVAKLESDVGHLVTDMAAVRDIVGKHGETLASIRERLATLESDVKHLPSKDFVVKVVVGAFAVLSAITLFQGQLQHLFGITK